MLVISNLSLFVVVKSISMVSASPLRDLKISVLDDYLPVSHTNPLIKYFLP
jgi:hypothetical protein